MEKITAIRIGRGRQKQIKIFLNGKLAFSLEAEVAVRNDLRVGQELSMGEIETLVKEGHFRRCLNAAAHYLSYRPRSESELRERLHRRGFGDSVVEGVLTKLKEQGLVDDMAFAHFWKDNRESCSPRSQRLTKLELRRKGIANDVINEVVDAVNDDDSAYRAALGKARTLPLSDYQGFHRRLGGYLKRRGFNYEVINHTVQRLWHEWGSDAKAAK